MKEKYVFLFFLIFVFTGWNLFGQSNSVIDTLLGESAADFGNSAYMVLTGAGLLDEGSDVSEGLKIFAEGKWNALAGKRAEDPLTLGEYSFLITGAFDIQGGLMYRLFPGPRYAVRELKYLGIIDRDADPSVPVSGEDVIRILGYVLEWKDNGK